MKLVKIIDKTKKFTDKNGNERDSVSFYVEAENGYRVLVRTVFSTDYSKLSVLADSVVVK